METTLLTARAAAGDLDSFGQLYDLYFGRVYDLTWRILRDADAAGSITRDVFEAARNELRSMVGADFGAWVLLAATRAALARAEQSSSEVPRVLHEEAFGSFDAPDPCRLNDPKLTGGDHALACTVWEAATTLGARDYASLDLELRQHLEAPVIAPILGVTKGNARTALERLASAADEAMLTYVLARRGGAACEPLRAVLAEAGFPPYDDAVRQAVDAHAAACATCRATRVLPSRPTEILGGLLPVQAPFVLKSETWRSLVAAWPIAGVTAGAAALEAATQFARSSPGTSAGPATTAVGGAPALDLAFDGDGGGGFGGPIDAPSGFGDDGNRNIIWFAAAAIGMIVVAFLIGGIAVGAFGLGGGGSGGASAAATHTSTPAASTPQQTPSPGVHIDSPTPAPSSSPAPAATDTPAPAATPTSPPLPTPIRAASATPTRIVVPTPIVPTPTPPRLPTPGGPPTPTATVRAIVPGPTPIVP
jgi:DNA-directed RNA polymerase specialized sigma24 family protein